MSSPQQQPSASSLLKQPAPSAVVGAVADNKVTAANKKNPQQAMAKAQAQWQPHSWWHFLLPQRLLPLTITVMVLMFFCRAVDLGLLLATGKQQSTIQQAQASEKAVEAGKEHDADAKTAEKKSDEKKPDEKADHKADEAHKTDANGKTVTGSQKAGAAPALPDTPPGMTALPRPISVTQGATGQKEYTTSEVELLQSLSAKRQELDKREGEMVQREALLKASEERMDRKIQELTNLRAEMEKLLQLRESQENTRTQSLVKIYETMKPKDAARIFDSLEMNILLSVLEKMKESKTAPIFAEMDAKKVQAITVEISQKRKLPAERQAAEAVGGASAATSQPAP
ncbi:MAG: MotE family protein [Alphaproteobacteria bacterium]